MTPQTAPQAQGVIDVDQIIAKIQVPPNLKSIYDKSVLAGMNIMFSKDSHQMALAELSKPGPMATNLSNGIIALVYLLLKKSNGTLPPHIIIPLTVTFVLRAFQFLQQSKDPQATPQVLGEAMDQAVTGVMQRAGVSPEQLPQLVKQATAGMAPTTQKPSGLLQEGM